MNKMNNYQKRKCAKCGRKCIKNKDGWYLSIENRGNRKDRETGFICNLCYKKMERWFKRK